MLFTAMIVNVIANTLSRIWLALAPPVAMVMARIHLRTRLTSVLLPVALAICSNGSIFKD
jgi:hypothetical protein